MTDRDPSKASEFLQQSIGSRETIAPSGIDSTPTGSGPFASLPVVFGRFEVKKLLGRGNMGSVYLAVDPQLYRPEINNEVALKIPKFQADDDPTLLERFWREAQATGAMNHPNICKLYEVGEISGTHYISMEYVDGRPLSDYVGPDQPQRQVAAIIRKLALGFGHAHERGFIHRDLKPSNVMIATDGQPKIMDFGLARRFGVTGDIKLTQSNTIVGSPAYMSPEQARSENDTLTPASDIYCLGTLFFELLTGELPFKGPMAIVLGMIALNKVPKPSTVRPDVDPRLEALCLKMQEKKPASRPQSMTEVADTLTEWLKPATTKSNPTVALVEEPVALSPKKAAPPRADKADGIDAHKQRVIDLLDKRQYGPAIELLEKITNLRDARFEQLVAWAKPKLKEVRATEQKLREASAPSCDTARQLLKHYDYAGAIQVLEQVPPAYRSLELRDLLEEVTNTRDECDHLQRDIEEAIRTGDSDTLPALVKRLLKLRPNSKAIKKLAEDLKQHGAKKVIAQRKGQRRVFESNDRAFETKHIVGSIVLVAGLFLGVSLLVRNYLANSGPTIVTNALPPVTGGHEPPPPPPPPDGWVSLFNGKDLTGWDGDRAIWRVENGMIVGLTPAPHPSKASAHLVYKEHPFTDFELEVEFKLDGGNGGIAIRGKENVGSPVRIIGYHAALNTESVFVTLSHNGSGTSANRGERVLERAERTLGTERNSNAFGDAGELLQKHLKVRDWNKLTVIAQGSKLLAKCNDQEMCELVDELNGARFRDGLIALVIGRSGGERISFRNVRIRELSANAEVPTKRKFSREGALAELRATIVGGGRVRFHQVVAIWQTQSGVPMELDEESLKVANLSRDMLVEHDSQPKSVATKIGELLTKTSALRLVWDEAAGQFVFTTDAGLRGRGPAIVANELLGNELSATAVAPKAGDRRVLDLQGVKYAFRWCPPGTFAMGSPASEAGRGTGENQVTVELTKGYWTLETEVTQSMWSAVMNTRPWQGQNLVREGANYPATYIKHDDAMTFCQKLTTVARQANVLSADESISLPTEAQWEYACRAGTTTAYSYGNDPSQLNQFAWHGLSVNDNAHNYAHEVGAKQPNPWGLSDNHGNVWEWCSDWYGDQRTGGRDPQGPATGTERCYRGGAWNIVTPDRVRSAWRSKIGPQFAFHYLGFRIVFGSESAASNERAAVALPVTPPVPKSTVGRETLSCKGHTREVMSVAFSADGKRLASAGMDNTVRVWDAASGQNVFTLSGHTSGVEGVTFSADGKRLASASYDQTVRVWDATSDRGILNLKASSNLVWSVAFSADGKRLASASSDQTVKIWDATSGKLTRTLKGHTAPVKHVTFSADGKRLASAGYDNTARVWDATNGQLTLTLNGHSGRVFGVAFSPDGKWIASASDDKTIKVWDATSGKETQVLRGHTGAVHSVKFSADGLRLASASADQTAMVWDASNGQVVLTMNGHSAPVWCVSFSTDGKRLASASADRTVRLWDVTPQNEAK